MTVTAPLPKVMAPSWVLLPEAYGKVTVIVTVTTVVPAVVTL